MTKTTKQRHAAGEFKRHELRYSAKIDTAYTTVITPFRATQILNDRSITFARWLSYDARGLVLYVG